jgi:hypothetical protein
MRQIRLTMLFLLGLLLVGSQGADASSHSATVTILHGLPRFTADVYVNGELLLDGFEPESATEPLSLEPADYDVAIRSVGAAPDSAPVLEASLTVEAGVNYSAIAHLTTSGEPTISVFRNDMSRVSAGRTRVVGRHVAEAPALDLRLDGDVVFGGIRNSAEQTKVRAPGRYMFDAAEAGGGDRLVDSVPVSLSEGTATILYVMGSSADDTLDVMVQGVTNLASSPARVPSGSGGLAAPDRFPVWAVGLLSLAALATAGAAFMSWRSRRPSSP